MRVRITILLFLFSCFVAEMVGTTRGAAIRLCSVRQAAVQGILRGLPRLGRERPWACRPLSSEDSVGPHHAREAARRNVP